MNISVQPRHVDDNPAEPILQLEIVIIPEPDLDDDQEEKGVREFLDQLLESETIEITAVGQTSFVKGVSLRASGRRLAIDW